MYILKKRFLMHCSVFSLQIYEGLAYMDFSKELFETQGHGKYAYILSIGVRHNMLQYD